MKVMRRIFIDLLVIVLVLVANNAADVCWVFAFRYLPVLNDITLIHLTSMNIFVFGASLIGGRILGRRQWYLVAIAPIIYFGHLSIGMRYPRFLYVGLNMPLSVISALCGGYIGAYIRKDDEQ